ncbi:hypothetical protein BCR34DRAFT_623245 [Clohesyomyces aquaticus]|uniref:Uncharacterized protein n=1 Tax=Clohesyomyces aquaticus TaxID=1231657 RepID=A0A1Y1ZWQ2_9PLEO|nr:hypothetical protein BCR34DRAFT_623245 [Clohesyomyces aquaticus]
MLHLSLLALFVLSPFLASASPTPALQATTAAAPKPSATITSVVADAPDVDTEGSGCRSGSVSVAFSTDYSLMNILFLNFRAAVGPDAAGTKKRAFCRVNVTMSSPGWAFDVTSVDFRGYIKMDSGVNASLVSRWKWIDEKGVDLKGKGNINKKLRGPLENDFLLHKDGEISDSEQSVCVTKANAKFQLSLSATLTAASSTLDGLVQGDAADTSQRFGEVLNLGWRKC